MMQYMYSGVLKLFKLAIVGNHIVRYQVIIKSPTKTIDIFMPKCLYNSDDLNWLCIGILQEISQNDLLTNYNRLTLTICLISEYLWRK